MAGRLGSIRPKEFIRKLKKAGFKLDHQSGSYAVLINLDGVRLVVPIHAREMKRGLLMDLLKRAGLSPDKLRKL